MSIVLKNVWHLVLWLFAGPWLTAFLWFMVNGLKSVEHFHLVGIFAIAPYALFYGFIGMAACLLGTMPAYLVSVLIFNCGIKWQRQRWFSPVFIFGGCMVGAILGAWGNRLLNTGQVEYALLLLSVTGGAVIAYLTIKIWRLPEC